MKTVWKTRLMVKESHDVPTPKLRPEFLGHVAYRINHRFQCAPRENKVVKGNEMILLFKERRK